MRHQVPERSSESGWELDPTAIKRPENPIKVDPIRFYRIDRD